MHSPAASLEEAEVLEEHKIRAFIAMLEGLQALGIPLPEQGDAKPIEQWPLVQAYALQDFEALTGGGFLTQRLRCVAGEVADSFRDVPIDGFRDLRIDRFREGFRIETRIDGRRETRRETRRTPALAPAAAPALAPTDHTPTRTTAAIA